MKGINVAPKNPVGKLAETALSTIKDPKAAAGRVVDQAKGTVALGRMVAETAGSVVGKAAGRAVGRKSEPTSKAPSRPARGGPQPAQDADSSGQPPTLRAVPDVNQPDHTQAPKGGSRSAAPGAEAKTSPQVPAAKTAGARKTANSPKKQGDPLVSTPTKATEEAKADTDRAPEPTAEKPTVQKKAPAKKPTAEKPTVQKKAPAKKPTAKQAPATEPTAKQAPATEPTAKPAPATEPTAKPAPAKKVTATPSDVAEVVEAAVAENPSKTAAQPVKKAAQPVKTAAQPVKKAAKKGSTTGATKAPPEKSSPGGRLPARKSSAPEAPAKKGAETDPS